MALTAKGRTGEALPRAVPVEPPGGAVVLDPPGPGNNQAFGTCFLGGDPMHCEFSGGTGTFTWFHTSVVVTVTDPGTPDELWHWAGTYRFAPS